MVHHMDKSPLLEVLGSFACNAVTRKSCEKYQVVKYSEGICIDMGIKFSVDFAHWKISWIFIGTGIGVPVYSGIKIFIKSSHSKFGCTENY